MGKPTVSSAAAASARKIPRPLRQRPALDIEEQLLRATIEEELLHAVIIVEMCVVVNDAVDSLDPVLNLSYPLETAAQLIRQSIDKINASERRMPPAGRAPARTMQPDKATADREVPHA